MPAGEEAPGEEAPGDAAGGCGPAGGSGSAGTARDGEGVGSVYGAVAAGSVLACSAIGEAGGAGGAGGDDHHVDAPGGDCSAGAGSVGARYDDDDDAAGPAGVEFPVSGSARVDSGDAGSAGADSGTASWEAGGVPGVPSCALAGVLSGALAGALSVRRGGGVHRRNSWARAPASASSSVAFASYCALAGGGVYVDLRGPGGSIDVASSSGGCCSSTMPR